MALTGVRCSRQAVFEKGAKKAQRNIELTAWVCLNDGSRVHNCIWLGAGDKPVNEYNSVRCLPLLECASAEDHGAKLSALTCTHAHTPTHTHTRTRTLAYTLTLSLSHTHMQLVLYHNNDPQWNETIKLVVPVELYKRAHIKFYFRHCSSTETREKSEKDSFSFTFIRLDDNGTAIKVRLPVGLGAITLVATHPVGLGAITLVATHPTGLGAITLVATENAQLDRSLFATIA